MAKFQARIALFDNSEAVADNDMAPALTGKLEISESQIELLMDELMNAEVQTYGTRRYKVIDLAAWETDGSSALRYSGKARMPYKKSQTSASTAPAPVDSATDVHGNPTADDQF